MLEKTESEEWAMNLNFSAIIGMTNTTTKKIDLIIIGAQKSGTTSLLRYLGEHPQVASHPQKEFAYFLDPEEYGFSFKKSFRKYFSGYDSNKHKALIAKSASLYSDEEALQRLKALHPDIQLVILLRNPVDRMYSSFLMEKNAASVTIEFNDYVDQLLKSESVKNDYFIKLSSYNEHLKKVYSIFENKNIHIYLYEDLKHSPLKICEELYTLLGVDPSFKPKVEVVHNRTVKTKSRNAAKLIHRFLKNKNIFKRMFRMVIPDNKAYKLGEIVRKSNKSQEIYPEMDPDIRIRLENYFQQSNLELEQLTGRDLSAWISNRVKEESWNTK